MEDKRAHRPRTELEIEAFPFYITFRISGCDSEQARKAVALALFRRVKPVFRAIRRSEIHHGNVRWTPDYFERQVNDDHAAQVDDLPGQVGLRIRIRRLTLGWRLSDLAEKARVNAGHLSGLERGKYKAHVSTLERINHTLHTEEILRGMRPDPKAMRFGRNRNPKRGEGRS